MRAFYNEIDRYCCDWLQNLMDAGLITSGKIDDRSIADLSPDDCRGYERCHFFAGIAGWELALSLSGYTGPVWTGSCPCQPFSSASAGKDKQGKDKRHLWPHWKLLISELAPICIFGEQVADAGLWFDGVCDDLEELGYSVGASVLPACSVGFDHARARIYFVGHSDRYSQSRRAQHAAKASRMPGNNTINGVLEFENGIPRRVAVMRAFGNAIVPQVAAEFIKASMI